MYGKTLTQVSYRKRNEECDNLTCAKTETREVIK